MEEVILEGTYSGKKFFSKLILWCVIFAVISVLLISVVSPIVTGLSYYEVENYDEVSDTYIPEKVPNIKSPIYFAGNLIRVFGLILLCLCVLFFVASIIILLLNRKTKITVTETRISGIGAFGKNIDIPIEHIHAIGTCMLNGVVLVSAYGKTMFFCMDNRNEICETVNYLLMQYRNKAKAEDSKSNSITQSDVDELKRYKDLLDSGILTQEEFDTKKKQLIGM